MATASWRISLGSGGGVQQHLTVVVKATLAYSDSGQLSLIEPEPIVREWGRAPVSAVPASSDLAPYLSQADLWLTGHAHVPGPEPVPAASVRLAVGRQRPLVDKTLHVYGDRPAGQDPADGPEPFRRLALGFERAVAGADNPAGDRDRRPNIIDPSHPARATCYSLIPPAWPARQELLGTASTELFDEAIWDLPDGLDWTFFQAAPEDQRCRFLQGDEWIVIDGMHSEQPRIKLQLPKLSAHASVLSPGAGDLGHAIALMCDGLHIDADRQRCTLRWRGCFPVIEPSRLGELRVVSAVAAADGTWLGTEDGGTPSRSSSAGLDCVQSLDLPSPDEAALGGAALGGAARGGAALGGVTLPGRGGDTLVGGTEVAASPKPQVEMPDSARGTLLGTTGSGELRDKLGIPPADKAPAGLPKGGQRFPVPWRSRLALSHDEASLLREQLGIPALEGSTKGDDPAALGDVSATASLSDDAAVALRAKLALPFPQPKTRPARNVPLRPVYIPGAPWCQAIDAPPNSAEASEPELGPTPAPPTLPGYEELAGDLVGGDDS